MVKLVNTGDLKSPAWNLQRPRLLGSIPGIAAKVGMVGKKVEMVGIRRRGEILVNTQDLKSCFQQWICRFDAGRRYKKGSNAELVRRLTVNQVICMDGRFESCCSHKYE